MQLASSMGKTTHVHSLENHDTCWVKDHVVFESLILANVRYTCILSSPHQEATASGPLMQVYFAHKPHEIECVRISPSHLHCTRTPWKNGGRLLPFLCGRASNLRNPHKSLLSMPQQLLVWREAQASLAHPFATTTGSSPY